MHGTRTWELYPRQYATDGSIVSHLRFALRHEAFDLAWCPGPGVRTAWVRAEPTGAFSRRAWFFYETFTAGNWTWTIESYVKALDPKKHDSRRHRVADNLLGGRGLCPMRLTQRLMDRIRTSRPARSSKAMTLSSSLGPPTTSTRKRHQPYPASRRRFHGGARLRSDRHLRSASMAPDRTRVGANPELRGCDRRRVPRGGELHLPATRRRAADSVDEIDPAFAGVDPSGGGGGRVVHVRLHPPVRRRERAYPPP